MSDIYEINDFLGYMRRGGGTPNHSQEEREALAKLVIASAKEKDNILKLKTSRLAKELEIDISHEQKQTVYQLISNESSKILARYEGETKQTPDQSFISKESMYNDIKYQLREAARCAERAMGIEEKRDMAKACLLLQKEVLYCLHPTLHNADGTEISSLDLKNNEAISITGDFTTIKPDGSTDYGKVYPENTPIESFYRASNGDWLIETKDAVYTNIDFSAEYELAALAAQKAELEVARSADPEFMRDRQNAIDTINQITPNITSLSNSQHGAWLDQFGVLPKTLNEYNPKADGYIRDVVEACLSENIPIIQTDRDKDIDPLIRYRDPSVAVDCVNFVTQLPYPGEKITLPPSSQFLGDYDGYQDLLPDTECVVLEVAGTPGGYVVLTDIGLLTSYDMALELERHMEIQSDIGDKVEFDMTEHER